MEQIDQLRAMKSQVQALACQLEGLLRQLEEEQSRGPAPEVWVGLPEFCRLAGISRGTIYNLWAKGEGPPARRKGSRNLFPATAVNRQDWSHRRPE